MADGHYTVELARPVVKESSELDRIIALPEKGALPPLDFTALKKPPPEGGCRCEAMGRPCCAELLDGQAAWLTEAYWADGLMLGAGVGHGKELVFMLLPLVMRNVRTAVLLITPDMTESLKLDWEYYGQHWVSPNIAGGSSFVPDPLWPVLHVLAYSKLQHMDYSNALRALKPDLVMGNEAHNLRPGSTRTNRLMAHGAERWEARHVFGSGTLMVRSIKDAAHLSALSLKAGSPYPMPASEALEEWASAIDPEDWRGNKLPGLPGALRRLCRDGEDVRAAFKRRRLSTLGVVDTSDPAIPVPLNFHRRDPPPIPDVITEGLKAVAAGKRPDGEDFEHDSMRAKCAHELAAGFYYRWVYPHNKLPDDIPLIKRWFAARYNWDQEVGELLERYVPYLDSPGLAMRAAARAELGLPATETKPAWKSRAFAEWRAVRKLVKPVTQAVWLSDWLARDAAAWAGEKPGIVWYSSRAFGMKVQELSGLTRYGEGKDASRGILREDGKRSIIAAAKAHNKNKDLTRFSRNLVTQALPAASMWEQLPGRTHRRGQRADQVDLWAYLHTNALQRAFARAVEQARFVEETTSNKLKLCYATYTFQRPW